MKQPLLKPEQNTGVYKTQQSQNPISTDQNISLITKQTHKRQKNNSNLEQNKNQKVSSNYLSIIQQYNLVIDCYNNPLNIIQNCQLQKMPISTLYNEIFLSLQRSLKSKIIAFIVLFIPLIDIFFMLFSFYFVKYYFNCLGIHNKNKQKVHDPFQKMTFDPQLCFTLKKDYYFFTIQFKQLEGFSLNYNKKIREEISLRKERGKVQFMIYNAKFWSYYNHFQRWKKIHIALAIFSLIITLGINIGLAIIIF